MQISTKRLRAILESISIISSSMETDEVLQKIMHQLTELLNAEAASIFLIDESNKLLEMKIATNLSKKQIESIKVPIGKGLVGYAVQTGELINIKNPKKDKRFYSLIDKQIGFTTKSILTIPLKIDSKIVGAAQVINKKNNKSFSKEDELVITEFSRLASITLNKALMLKEILAKKIMESDLQLALKIQQQLIPQKELNIGNFLFRGFYKPAKYVGGDYFDYFPINKNEIFFTIADVTGKGVKASLIMASFRTYIYSLLEATNDLELLANNLNKFFYKYYPPEMLITSFIGIINIENGILTYINCGHELPRVLTKNNELIKLESNATLIGAFDFSEFKVSSYQLNKGDLIFLFTDGVPDTIDKNENRFSTERLDSFLLKLASERSNSIEKLNELLNKFNKNSYQVDDITLLTIEYI